MLLPLNVESFVWIAGFPIVTVKTWIYVRPEDHAIKRLWWRLVRSKASSLTLGQLAESKVQIPDHLRIQGRWVFLILICLFALWSLLSLGVNLGIFENPPKQ